MNGMALLRGGLGQRGPRRALHPYRVTSLRRPRRGLTLVAAAALLLIGGARVDAQQLYDRGLRWLGRATTCQAPPDWHAERLFSLGGLPRELSELCLYTWLGRGLGTAPRASDLTDLAAVSEASGLTEDVPVLFPMSAQELAAADFQRGLRDAVLQQVGSSSVLPAWPRQRLVRVAVIDSAPDAPHANISPGASRHGDTLAHLIEDLVCKPLACDGACDTEPAARPCAAEVTTELTLPWLASGERGASGGHRGTLADLARAIERALLHWQVQGAPPRLILNLSVGWEHTAQIAECGIGAPELPPAQAVRGIMQHAVSKGVLVVAAAGNDSGGAPPRSGLLCPAAWQAVPQTSAPTRPLLVAASGVDYADRPLESTRPLGIAALAGLGLGGVSWIPDEPMPPALVGSSVSAAVVSAVSALVWAAKPSATSQQVWLAAYQGGVDLGAADQCPVGLPSCRTRRVTTCGALRSIGASPVCTVPSAHTAGTPYLGAELAALGAAWAALVPDLGQVTSPVSPSALPRYQAPTVQVDPALFPQPISATCPTCWVSAGALASPGARQLTIPAVGEAIEAPSLVVRSGDGALHAVALPTTSGKLLPGASYAFTVPLLFDIVAAYLTGFTDASYTKSVTQQIFVEP